MGMGLGRRRRKGDMNLRPTGKKGCPRKRMRTFGLLGAIFAFILFLMLGVWGFYIEPSSLTTHRETLKIPHWPPELQGLKIAVLTDLHVGSPFIDIEKVKLVVARTNEEHPDLVLILGDYLTHSTLGATLVYPEAIANTLKGLRSRLGAVSVLGNHDWWFDGRRVTRALEGAGIVVR